MELSVNLSQVLPETIVLVNFIKSVRFWNTSQWSTRLRDKGLNLISSRLSPTENFVSIWVAREQEERGEQEQSAN